MTCVIACEQKLGRESGAILEIEEVNSRDNRICVEIRATLETVKGAQVESASFLVGLGTTVSREITRIREQH